MLSTLKKGMCALVFALIMSAPVMAAENGFYAGLKFIDSIQNTGNSSADGTIDTVFDFDGVSQNTFGGGVFVGYDFYPRLGVPIRAEVEYALRSPFSTTQDRSASGAYAELEGEWSTQTLFLNAYLDFHNSTDFTPYIGAGLGLGFTHSSYELNWAYAAYAENYSVDDYQTVFAWNVGVGCAYAFTDNLSADLAYRFVGLDYRETEEAGQKIGMTPYAHEFSLGLRFTF